MSFDPARLLAHPFTPQFQNYTRRDAIIYALGIGMGQDPTDEEALAYLLETRNSTPPTFAVTLGSPGMWVKDRTLGIDWVRLIHTAQTTRFEFPLPPEGNIVSTARIAKVADLGAEKGAEIVLEREVRDAGDGRLYCAIAQTLLLRGNGGFGGPALHEAAAPIKHDRSPDVRVTVPLSPRAALIYRLSGDWNPIHADPHTARAAGFERPILHGLASFGIAAMTLLKDAQPKGAQLRSLSVRFTGIVYPGDNMHFSIWHHPGRSFFEAHVGSRRVLGSGVAEIG